MRSCVAVCYAAVVLSLLIMLGGCAGQGAPESAGTQSTAHAEELAALDSLAAPGGVDAALWGKLTAELARVLAERTASVPPAGAASATILTYDEASAALGWGYYSAGDYDQNGEVGISDLTPLGIHFGKTAGEGEGGSFDPTSIEAVVDGNGDGEINIADITPIGVNFGVVMEGYRVYMSESVASYPPEADAPNGTGTTWIDSVSFASASDGAGAGRKRFSVQVVPTLSAQHFWVRPYEGSADGAASNYVVVKLPPKTAPQAKLSASGTPSTPARITWDASESSDADGQIVRYEWDFDDDGEYEYDSGDTPTADFYYYEEGNYGAAVRVTDDDGLADTASWAVIISTAATWHINIADERLRDQPNDLPMEAPIALLEVEGNPAMFYTRRLDVQNPETNGWWYIVYLRAEDPQGESWPEPVVVDWIEPGGANGFAGTAAVVDGRPALTYRHFLHNSPELNDLESRVLYQRASDTTGTSWPGPMVINSYIRYSYGVSEGESFGKVIAFFSVEGKPAILGIGTLWDTEAKGYVRANDASGSSWPEPYEPGLDISKLRDELGILGGLPAVVSLENADDMLYYRALDATALTWTEPAVLIDEHEKAGDDMRLIEAAGHPAVVYYDTGTDDLKYRRALDTDGTAWGEPVILDARADGNQIAGVIAGRPVVFYGDRVTDTMKFIAANDAEGARWGFSMDLDLDRDMLDYYLSSMSLPREISGNPALGYIDSFQSAEGDFGRRLHFVAYY